VKLKDVLANAGIVGDLPTALGQKEVALITADSRKVKAGALFFAMPGSKADGLSFAAQAAANGALAIVADRMPDADPGVPLLVADAKAGGTRAALAHAAVSLYPGYPANTVAITGTSGKTSVAVFTRQIWAHAGLAGASLGTIGVVTPNGARYGSLTTPDPVTLHKILQEITLEGVTHLAMEASSHGLDQYRLDSVTTTAAAFLNLSRDHLDYHPTMEDYFQAKMAIFTRISQLGHPAIISATGSWRQRAVQIAERAGLEVITVGRRKSDIWIRSLKAVAGSQEMVLEVHGTRAEVKLPLVGDFQAMNAATALALAVHTGVPIKRALDALEHLVGVPGRLEAVGSVNDAPVLVDYAHKPEALKSVLATLRKAAAGRLINVFGCGGDRDAGKRPIMGEISARGADITIVTDDNPRSENPASIRRSIMAAAPGAREIGDRAEAIETAVNMLRAGDVLVIAGKGHEEGQIVGNTVLPFSDHAVARAAILKAGGKVG
jgi:UDP-N-acetylmuramyl-tripeptide synthetase